MTSNSSLSLVPPDPSDVSTLVSEEPSVPNIKQDSDVPVASTSKLPSSQDTNPWMTSVTNVEFKDMPSSIFNFGPTPWPSIKGKGVDKASTSSASPTSFLGGGGIPSVVLAPAPPLGQQVSLGNVSLDPQPDPEELKIEYKCGGHPRMENLENENEVERVLHVNGSVYYRHKFFRTSEDLSSQPGTTERFKQVSDEIYEVLRKSQWAPMHAILEPDGTVIIQNLDSEPIWHWVSPSRGLYIEPILEGESGVKVEKVGTKYWSDLEAFPDLLPLSRDLEADFLNAMTFGANERILGWNDTPFPFSESQIQRLVRVYKDLKGKYRVLDKSITTLTTVPGQVDAGNELVYPAFNYHIARAMVKIEEYRRKAKFGTPDYELYRPVVASATSWKVGMVERCLMVLLFGAHKSYRMRLQRARVQGTVYLADFRELIGNFLVEWSDSNLLATVFVGANIAFLAAPEVNNLQRTASLASTICSLTSIVTGVHHVWQHRAKVNASHDEARQYLARIQPLNDNQDSDLAIVAIFLSIPLVALLYALLSFSIALGAYCIQNSSIHGRILLAVFFGIAGMTGLVTLVFFWHVWRGPRTVQISDEDIDIEMAYGWTTTVKGKLRKGRRKLGVVMEGVEKRLVRAKSMVGRKKHPSHNQLQAITLPTLKRAREP